MESNNTLTTTNMGKTVVILGALEDINSLTSDSRKVLYSYTASSSFKLLPFNMSELKNYKNALYAIKGACLINSQQLDSVYNDLELPLSLEALILKNVTLSPENIKQLSQKFVSLRYLCLYNCITLYEMNYIFANFENLRELHVRFGKRTENLGHVVIEPSKNLKDLIICGELPISDSTRIFISYHTELVRLQVIFNNSMNLSHKLFIHMGEGSSLCLLETNCLLMNHLEPGLFSSVKKLVTTCHVALFMGYDFTKFKSLESLCISQISFVSQRTVMYQFAHVKRNINLEVIEYGCSQPLKFSVIPNNPDGITTITLCHKNVNYMGQQSTGGQPIITDPRGRILVLQKPIVMKPAPTQEFKLSMIVSSLNDAVNYYLGVMKQLESESSKLRELIQRCWDANQRMFDEIDWEVLLTKNYPQNDQQQIKYFYSSQSLFIQQLLNECTILNGLLMDYQKVRQQIYNEELHLKGIFSGSREQLLSCNYPTFQRIQSFKNTIGQLSKRFVLLPSLTQAYLNLADERSTNCLAFRKKLNC